MSKREIAEHSVQEAADRIVAEGLGDDERDLRLHCLHLAIRRAPAFAPTAAVMKDAEAFYAFAAGLTKH